MAQMMVATKAFTADYGGEKVTITEGERADSTHELVARYPDYWRSRGVEEELEIRSARIAELARHDDNREHRRVVEDSPAVRARHAEETFWRTVDRQLHGDHDGIGAAERREQRFFDEAIEQADQLRADEFDNDMLDLSKAWGRRIA